MWSVFKAPVMFPYYTQKEDNQRRTDAELLRGVQRTHQ